MHVAIYCRVSTDEQAKLGESIIDQETALVRWAEEHGHTYDVFPDEGYSAHKVYKSRPALMRLLDRIDEFQLIIFTKFDRWTRKAADYYKLQEVLDRHGVAWKAILEDYETVTADGRFKVGIMLSVNQHEAERTSDRIKFTFAEKRKRGELCSGNLPRGYKIEDGKPVKDGDAAGVAAFWREYFAGGLNAAIDAAAAEGVTIRTSSGAYMLKHAHSFAGEIQGIPCEPYITKAQADSIADSRTHRPKSAGHDYTFSGLVFCAECGHRFGGHINRYKRADGEDGVQVFYNCTWRHKTHPCECGNRSCIMERDIDKFLVEYLTERIGSASAVQKTQKPRDTSKKRAQLEAKKRRAYEAYIDGIVSKDEFELQRAKLDGELAKLDVIPMAAPVYHLPVTWQKAYESFTPAQKREFWRGIGIEVVVNADRSMDVRLA